jgi:hypothetical protein
MPETDLTFTYSGGPDSRTLADLIRPDSVEFHIALSPSTKIAIQKLQLFLGKNKQRISHKDSLNHDVQLIYKIENGKATLAGLVVESSAAIEKLNSVLKKSNPDLALSNLEMDDSAEGHGYARARFTTTQVNAIVAALPTPDRALTA